MFNTNESKLFNRYLREAIDKELATINRQIISFIKERDGCDKMFCGTCGGLLGFSKRFFDFLNTRGINPVLGLCAIYPEDLIQIEKWDLVFEFLIQFNQIGFEKEIVFRTWRNKLGRVPDFDLFILKNLISEEFLSTLEGRKFLTKVLFSPINSNKNDLLKLLTTQADIEFESLINLYKRIVMDAKVQQNEEELFLHNLWKECNAEKYKAIIDNVEYQVRIEEEFEKEKITKETNHALELSRIERERTKQIHEIGNLEPQDRLKAIIQDDSLQLNNLPQEWSEFDVSCLETLESKVISALILGLKGKIKNKEIYTYGWRRLVQRLYLVRQNAMKREYNQRQLENNKQI